MRHDSRVTVPLTPRTMYRSLVMFNEPLLELKWCYRTLPGLRVKSKIWWIFINFLDTYEAHPNGRGTRAASKAVGGQYGVSRNSHLTIVKAAYAIIGSTTAFWKVDEDLANLPVWAPKGDCGNIRESNQKLSPSAGVAETWEAMAIHSRENSQHKSTHETLRQGMRFNQPIRLTHIFPQDSRIMARGSASNNWVRKNYCFRRWRSHALKRRE